MGGFVLTEEFALLHLIERITAKEITDRSLETELKNIIRERDEIVTDRFDEIIVNSIVMDIEKSTDLKSFFNSVSSKLSEKLNIGKDIIYDKLIKKRTGKFHCSKSYSCNSAYYY